MDRLCSILEEAQTVMSHDELAYQLKESNLNFPGMGAPFCNPMLAPSMLKPIAHKAARPVVKKRTWKKPKDKPKRPLSAYNLFFQHERKQIIAVLPEDKSVAEDGLTEDERRRKHRKTHGKIGFADLARNIALKWKSLGEEDRSQFVEKADIEKERYKKELEAWKKLNKDAPKKPKSEKKKPTPSLPSPQPTPTATISKVTPPTSAKPEALSSMLTSTVSAQRAQLLQLMASTQALASQLRQQNTNNMYGALYQNACQDTMMQQQHHRVNFQQQLNQQQRGFAQMNNSCGSRPMNPLRAIDLTTSLYSAEIAPQMQQQQSRMTQAAETFSKETFFEDVPVEESDPDVFSISSDSSEEKQVSLEDDINAFMDDFDSQIMMP